jgi:hypothetical protein
MPTGGPQNVMMAASSVQITMANVHLFVQVLIQSDGLDQPGEVEELVQDVVDMFQGWDKAAPGIDVTGQYYQTNLYPVTPTDPISPPEE